MRNVYMECWIPVYECVFAVDKLHLFDRVQFVLIVDVL